jgi:ribosomal protein L35
MYKIKTHKGFRKRFSITGNKKIKFFSSGTRHKLSKKSRKHNRLLKKVRCVKSSQINVIKKFIFCL